MAESSSLTVLGNKCSKIEVNKEESRYCWVCFCTEDDDKDADWIHPCTCCGSTKWVHQFCLRRWVDVQQKGNLMQQVFCPQCNTEYSIHFPDVNKFLRLLGCLDNVVQKVCPFIAGGIFLSAVYWVAVSYGAFTVIQVFGIKDGLTSTDETDPLALLIGLPAIPMILRFIGHNEGLTAAERADISLGVDTLLISLPAIPILLILGKMISWEDSVITILRKYSPKVPLLKFIMPSFAINNDETERRNTYDPSISDNISPSTLVSSALLLPTIATICGNILFVTVPSHFHRTLLGGITFIIIKGCLRIYYKQQLYIRQKNKEILDYTPPCDSETNSQLPNSQT